MYEPSATIHADKSAAYTAEKILQLLKETGCDIAIDVTTRTQGQVNLPPLSLQLRLVKVASPQTEPVNATKGEE